MKRLSSFNSLRALVFGLAVASMAIPAPASADPWKFGVISDTQWVSETAGYPDAAQLNPNTVAVSIIKQIDKRFIDAGVKLVVAVGDLGDSNNAINMRTRAAFAQELYNNGIGFFPLRGNHDSSADQANAFLSLFPQTQSGLMNATPANNLSDPSVIGAFYPAQHNTYKGTFTIGTNFISPDTITQTTPKGTFTGSLAGLSYAFTYRNTRFVLLDQFAPSNNNDSANPSTSLQQDWICSALAAKPADGHAFVFAHKGLIMGNHADGLFGTDPSQNPNAQNAFQKSLQDNGVRYLINGHDHMYNRGVVVSPDGTSSVQNITTPSDSSKVYIPERTANDVKYDKPPRETPIAQELRTIGYTVFTVDGPKVTAEVYTAQVPLRNVKATADVFSENTPTLVFSKTDEFGYSLNGKSFLIPRQASYTIIKDSYNGTTASILNGTNGSTEHLYDGRPTTKLVTTGWTPKDNGTARMCDHAESNILSLWGVHDHGANSTDTYVLSISYAQSKILPAQLGQGSLVLATWNGNDWINAVDKNNGGEKEFVLGPYKAGYQLGTYGIDPGTHTAWAVINYTGDFAVAGVRHLSLSK